MSIQLTGYDQRVRSTVASLRANLAELIYAMLHDGRSLIALCEFSDRRYVQFWIQADGRLFGEVVSNLNIVAARKLGLRGEQRLRELGFREPISGPQPNWWFAATSNAQTLRLLHMMNAAIFEVLEEVPANSVSISTWLTTIQPDDDLDELSRGLG